MKTTIFLSAFVATLIAIPVRAQHIAPATPAIVPAEASQFAFLVGEWTLAVTPKVSGLVATIHGVPKMRGTWKAWRALDGWGMEDELRIVDESGNPRAFTHFVRIFDASAKHWTTSAVDVATQRFTQATTTWTGSEMVSITTVADEDGKSHLTRTRIFAITPSAFRYQQDRSDDAGKTWDEARLSIQATRAAAVAPR